MIIALLFSLVTALSGEEMEQRLIEDLNPKLLLLKNGKFEPYQEGSANTVYLPISFSKNSRDYLEITSKADSYVFINSRLIKRGNHFMLRMDSLERKYKGNVLLSIYQAKAIDALSIKRISLLPRDIYANPARLNNSSSNFILIATLLLIIFFTTLLRTNPQLTLDYLNIIKLLSLKQRDETQFTLRITSSVNLLFYFFCSLLTSLALLIAARFSEEGISFLTNIQNKSTGWYFGQWIVIAIGVVIFLMLKLGLVTVSASLFGWKDASGFQFFNFVRTLVISLLIIGSISILCFSIRINADYYFLVKCFCGMVTVGVIFLYFKLMIRESVGPFHLFSYLCATEIFPLLILIKVFLF